MRRKGFTLVELLVVIAIIALLMGILMPALARVRQLAFRMTCGTNLSGIGKAMLIYANDYEDELPRAGVRDATLGTVNWAAETRLEAYNTNQASISSCFYLLVKYAEVTPKSFICKGDTGTTEFSLAEEDVTTSNFELIDAWDFGSKPWEHCSYSYHAPFGTYALSISSEPGLAVCSERNPWIDSPGAEGKTNFTDFQPDTGDFNGDKETASIGNSFTHQDEGQNVLFLDSHVEFAKRSFCSLEEDNIFTYSRFDDVGDALGEAPSSTPATGICDYVQNRKDSLLIHDAENSGGTVSRR
jgi:prepilin-type N-terminal cleavage/methylation domain-containing protein